MPYCSSCLIRIQAFITNGLLTLRCLNCNHETFRHDASHVTTLTYPDLVCTSLLQIVSARLRVLTNIECYWQELGSLPEVLGRT